MNLDEAFSAVVRLTAIGHFIIGIETIVAASLFSKKGVFAWRIMSLASPLGAHLHKALPCPISSHHAMRAVGTVESVFSLWLMIFGSGGTGILFALLFVLIGELVLAIRLPIGRDGADQILFISGLALLLGNCIGTDGSRTLALVFIGVQLSLSYFIAGVSKLAGIDWRNGSALLLILRTNSYGCSRLARITNLRCSRIVGYAVIAFEVFFPIIIFLPEVLPFLLLVGVAFHAATAALMGLYTFFFAFCGCYPSLFFLNSLMLGIEH